MMCAVGNNLGTTTSAAAPAAVRVTRPNWRDPRLWLGVAIMAICVVAGARLLASADDTAEVWALRGDHAAGSVLSADDLRVDRVHFADAADVSGYVRVGDPLPDRLTLLRAVGAGELLPRGAVADGAASRLAQLPVSVDAADLPSGLAPGSAVDVYVVARSSAQERPSALKAGQVVPVLAGVTVLDVGAADLGGPVTLTVAVPAGDVARYFARVARTGDAVITVVGRP